MQYFTTTTVLTALTALGSLATVTAATIPGIETQLKSRDVDPVPLLEFPIEKFKRGEDSSYLEERDDSIICCPVASWGWSDGDSSGATSGLNSINKEDGLLGFPTGCSMGRCIEGTGIYVCNDTGETLFVWGSDISTAGEAIVTQCSNICGQHFNSAGWNVIVHGNCDPNDQMWDGEQ